MIIIFSHWL